MSFRTRLTSFFVLIVVVPMVAIGFLGFRLISDSENGKADARASGLASAAASLYDSEIAAARAEARTLARDPALHKPATRQHRLSALAAAIGLTRATISEGPTTLADVGDRTAVAPGAATVSHQRGRPLTITLSKSSAADYAHALAGPGVEMVVDQGGRTLGTTLAGARGRSFPSRGTVAVDGTDYRALTLSFPGFGAAPVEVSVLSDVAATNSSAGSSKALAAAVIAAFLLLAFCFSVLASRALQGQLGRFLAAARRLAAGDFSAPIQTPGNDEFAALGQEFNNMSEQLANRLDELSAERARLRESIRRIGEAFVSNLDRQALLELALKTAVDAAQAGCGRLSVRPSQSEPLTEAAREGSFEGLGDAIFEAERLALMDGNFGDFTSEQASVLAAPLGPIAPKERAHGVITVARRGRPFNEDDRELLKSLATQAAFALENVELHFQVRRQAVTDELTGLANHGRFQEVLDAEMEQVRRYQYRVALIMLDIDNFKSINDTYGHQQGDVVLMHVARVVRDNSRDADSAARYGGEEMALILPHTDLDGAHAIAERVRGAVEALRIARLDGEGALRVTTSVGVAASAEGDKDGLIADADAALYEAKRSGKNRTVRARSDTANVFGGE
jgi:diguanylate cyclase (GGDEF)-like protein